ncbi:MAG: energy-coupling factor transporter transmembrane component T [Lachnospiraceae bacterium]|nr:energy-coupling factor transporter transmembrane component T [Lachnospiraceae bacterium]MDY5742227.1 energy-coupling factor transporter transmembrane component T [Lachnospiraceae bacterium]
MSPRLMNSNGIYPPLMLLISLLWLIVGMSVVDHKGCIGYLAVLVVLYLVYGYGRTLWRMLPVLLILCLISLLLSLPSGDTVKILRAVYRMALLGLTAVGPIGIEPIKLVRAMNRLGVSRGLTAGLLVALRFMRVLGVELGRIRRAVRLRGITVRRQPKLLYRALIVPFTVRLIGLSDTLTLSLETRGFRVDDQSFTMFEEVRMRRRDWSFAGLAAVLCTAAVMIRMGGIG